VKPKIRQLGGFLKSTFLRIRANLSQVGLFVYHRGEKGGDRKYGVTTSLRVHGSWPMLNGLLINPHQLND